MSTSSVRKIKHVLVKVRDNRKKLPYIAKNKAKKALRPAYHKVRRVGKKANYAIKLAASSHEREVYKMIRLARSFDIQTQTEDAQKSWQRIVEKYGPKTPLEAIIKLSRTYQHQGNFDLAKKVLDEAANSYLEDTIDQTTLQRWLALSKEKAEVSIIKRQADIEGYKKTIKQYNKEKKAHKKNKIAIVSAVSGGYDSFKPPEVLDSRFDYVVYSDVAVPDLGIFDVRPMPYLDSDNTRSARFIKTNITKLLPEYDYVMWIDANIMILEDIYPIVKKFIKSKKDFSAMLHPTRTSPYEEIAECLRSNKDGADAIIEQRDFYRSEGYDSDKLIESNILLYKVKSKKLDSFLGAWWNQIDKYSRRDQLSLNYCLDKYSVNWEPFTKRPTTSRNHPAFALMDHGKGNERFIGFINSLGGSRVDPYLSKKSFAEVKKTRLRVIPSGYTVTAVVCVHNALDDVKQCLEAIESHKSKHQKLIIMDDGSDAPTAKYLRDFSRGKESWVKYLRHEKARGYTVAASRGMKESDGDLTVLLNSDTVVTKDWAEKMAEVVISNKGVGIVGPMSSAASTQSLPNHESTASQTAINDLPENISIQDMSEFCERVSLEGIVPRVPLVHGFCIGITREVIERIGYFDHKSFPRGYGEENDYCFRAADAGFGLALATNTYVYHTKSKSFSSAEREKNMRDGARAFRDKHGQRRITRSVATMRKNPVLIRLRSYADRYYAQRFLDVADPTENVTRVITRHDFNAPSLADLTYKDLRAEMVSINTKLAWADETQKRRQKGLVSVIVLVYDNPELTLRCIDSVVARTEGVEYELVIVNNGSDLQTTQALQEFALRHPTVRLVHIDQNMNFSLGNNIGFIKSRGEVVVFLNNDTYVEQSDWLDRIIKPLAHNHAIKAVQPTLLYPDGEIQSAGTVFSDKSSLGYALYAGYTKDQLSKKATVRDHTLQAVTAACMAVRASDFVKVKGFDPLFINGQEDVDLCLRMRTNDEDCCMSIASATIFHDESKTQGRGRYVTENRKAFLERWTEVEMDDQRIYEEDGLCVEEYRLDSPVNRAEGVPLYTPKNIRIAKK